MSDFMQRFGVGTLLLAVSACAARQERGHVAPVAPPVAAPNVSPAAPKHAARPPAPFPPAPAPRNAASSQAVTTVQFTTPPEELPPNAAIAIKPLTLDELMQSVDLTYPIV